MASADLSITGSRTAAQVEQAVRRKLADTILSRTVGSDDVLRRFEIRIFKLSSWARELLLALSAAGLSHPLLSVLQGNAEAKESIPKIGGSPLAVYVASLVAITVYIAMRVYIRYHKLDETGPFTLAARRELMALKASIDAALSEGDPMPRLTVVGEKAREIVDRNFHINAWPWPIGPEDKQTEQRVQDEATRLVEKYKSYWSNT